MDFAISNVSLICMSVQYNNYCVCIGSSSCIRVTNPPCYGSANSQPNAYYRLVMSHILLLLVCSH